jgi:dihydrofolate reductase
MRQVVLGAYTSLDGHSVDEDNGMRDVMMSIDDPEQEEYFVSELSKAGTFIMGRVTYEGMAAFWPTSSHPSAGPMNDIPKVVFSRTLQSTDDWPARIASGDTAEEIAKLKAEPGGDIVVSGGTQFQRSLIRLGLVDEYRLWVLPAAAGKGEALFTGLDKPQRLRLVKSTVFPSSGVLELVYSPDH